MKVLITGATGFIGHHLLQHLFQAGHTLIVLTRNRAKAKKTLPVPCTLYEWDPLKGLPPQAALQGVEAVINLMGENLAQKRWTSQQKQKILESRERGTHHLVEGLENSLTAPLDVFISVSAVGIYPKNLDQPMTEDVIPAGDFLGMVCDKWEQAALSLQNTKTQRKVLLRLGVVLGIEGGVLGKILPIFKLGLGGILGKGQQWMSWIHIHDLVNIFGDALTNPEAQGIFNAVSPSPVTNKEFTLTLGHALGVKTPFPVPALALKLLFGEMSSVMLDGIRAVPKHLLKNHFDFHFPTINLALSDLCQKKPKTIL